MSRVLRRILRHVRALATLLVVGLLAAGCSNDPIPAAQPTQTTVAQPRVVAEPDPTTTSTTTTTTTTTTEAPPPPDVDVSLLGSVRSLPGTDTADEDAETDAVTVLNEDSATIASLACTVSTGCEPTDLAAWSANMLDVVNLATSAAAVDGSTVLDDHSAALLASGVATIGYGATLSEALEPAIVGDPDRPIAVYTISLAEGLPPELVATDTSPGIVAGDDALDLLVDQALLSQDAGQRVIVIMDFGRLEDRAPQARELDHVLTVVDSGVDAIVGHGSDFLQRFERIDETSVAFSLGNAVTNTEIPLRRDGAVFRFTVREDGTSACLLPATASASGLSMDDPETTDCP